MDSNSRQRNAPVLAVALLVGACSAEFEPTVITVCETNLDCAGGRVCDLQAHACVSPADTSLTPGSSVDSTGEMDVIGSSDVAPSPDLVDPGETAAEPPVDTTPDGAAATLVASWTFDDGADGSHHDLASGSTLTACRPGSPSGATRSGSTYHYLGPTNCDSNNGVLGVIGTVDFTKGVTLELWVWAPGPQKYAGVLAGWGRASDPNSVQVRLEYGYLLVSMNGPQTDYRNVIYRSALSLQSQWAHVAVVFPGAAGTAITVTVDGAPAPCDPAETDAGVVPSSTSFASGLSFAVGTFNICRTDPVEAPGLAIDDVSVWQGALDADTLAAHAAAGTRPPPEVRASDAAACPGAKVNDDCLHLPTCL